VPVAHGKYLAGHITRANLVELPGTEQSLIWEAPQLVLDHIEEFLTGARHGEDPSRVLATVLFTDIVGSTQQARGTGFAASTFGLGPGCTSARSSDATTTLAGWQCTSPPG
jgi:hypothetical protein